MQNLNRDRIRCPSCDVTLNRRLDLQFFGILLPQTALITLIFNLPIGIWQRIVASGLVAAACYFLDVLTVKLVVAGNRRGIVGDTAP